MISSVEARSSQFKPKDNSHRPMAIPVRGPLGKLRAFEDMVTVSKLAHVLAPLVVAGSIAFDTKTGTIHSQPTETSPVRVLTAINVSETPIIIEKDIIIVSGHIDIMPGVTFRTSPHINKAIFNTAQLPREFQGKTLRVHNARKVLGSRANPQETNSADRSHAGLGSWLSFEIKDQVFYVYDGPETSEFIDKSLAGSPVNVKMVQRGNISYYTDVYGQGYVPTYAEVYPPPDVPSYIKPAPRKATAQRV